MSATSVTPLPEHIPATRLVGSSNSRVAPAPTDDGALAAITVAAEPSTNYDPSRVPGSAVLAGLTSEGVHSSPDGEKKNDHRSCWQLAMPPGSELMCFLLVVIVVLVILSRGATSALWAGNPAAADASVLAGDCRGVPGVVGGIRLEIRRRAS